LLRLRDYTNVNQITLDVLREITGKKYNSFPEWDNWWRNHRDGFRAHFPALHGRFDAKRSRTLQVIQDLMIGTHSVEFSRQLYRLHVEARRSDARDRRLDRSGNIRIRSLPVRRATKPQPDFSWIRIALRKIRDQQSCDQLQIPGRAAIPSNGIERRCEGFDAFE